MNKKLTFDSNIIISLENKEPSSKEILEIIDFHEKELIDISIPAISASEKLKNGNYSQTFAQFQNRINLLSKREFEILKPIWFIGITFPDFHILPGDQEIDLDKRIHSILFPNTPVSLKNFCIENNIPENSLDPKWVNRKIDVISIWCHIYYEHDIFITNDKNFLKSKKLKLQEIGARSILSSEDAIKVISQQLQYKHR
jgi:hypothetical protein